jgi:hypothetical protein
MNSPRRLRPGGYLGPSLFQTVPQQSYVLGELPPVTIQGTYNGVVPALRPAPPPQPALVIRQDLVKGPQEEAVPFPFVKALRRHVDALLKAETAAEQAATQVSSPDAHLQTPNMRLARHDAAHVGMTEKMHAYRNVGNHAQANAYHKAAQHHAQQAASLRQQGVKLQGGEHEAWTDHYRNNEKRYAKHPAGDATHRIESHRIVELGHGAQTPFEQQQHQQRMYERRVTALPPGHSVAGRQPSAAVTEAGIAELRSASQQRRKREKAEDQQAIGTQATVAAKRSAIKSLLLGMMKASLPPGGEPFGKPLPERGKKEEKQDYVGRIMHELKHHGKERPHKQRVAIALEQARRSQKSISGLALLIAIPKVECAHKKAA